MTDETKEQIDIATVHIIRVGNRISMLSRGDGELGEMADTLLRTFRDLLDSTGEIECDEPIQTRDPYAGTKRGPQ